MTPRRCNQQSLSFSLWFSSCLEASCFLFCSLILPPITGTISGASGTGDNYFLQDVCLFGFYL